MKRKRFLVEQITTVLQQAELGVPIGDLCRQVGISEQNFSSVAEGVRQPAAE